MNTARRARPGHRSESGFQPAVLPYGLPLVLCMILAACSGPDTASDPPNLYGNIEHLAAQASAQVSRDDGWTIVALTEKGERVFWFVAPDVNGVSPALFKKTIKAGASSQQQTVIVSECEAPKQTCDDLAIKFESLSKKYK